MANDKELDGRVTNPKVGAGSGVSKPSSTDGDTGNKTTQSTPDGESVVDKESSK